MSTILGTVGIEAPERRSTPLGSAVAARPSVWWLSVPFAVALAAADGYWVTTLRGAVGAIQRVQHPMHDWLVQSTLVMPLYLAAVLVAIGVARRRGWASMRSALAVAGFGTIAGTAHLIGDSIFDYKLQDEHLSSMGSMGGLCKTACLHHQWVLTWHLQVRAVVLGVVLLAVTNLAVAAWVLALRGGRFDVKRLDAAAESRPVPMTVTMIAGVLAAAAIHAAVINEHLHEWWAAGTFFIVLTIVELINAVLLAKRPGAFALLTTVMVAFVPAVTWVWSRATGLPFGPEAWEPEAVGLPDVLCTILELIVLVQAVLLLRRDPSRPTTSPMARTRLASVAILAVTTVAVGNPLGLFGSAEHHSGSEDGATPAYIAPTHAGALNKGPGTP